MRFNYKNWPIWEAIESGDWGKIMIDDQCAKHLAGTDNSILWQNVLAEIVKYAPNGGVYYITKPFEEAIDKSWNKIAEAADFDKAAFVHGTGIYIFQNTMYLWIASSEGAFPFTIVFGCNRSMITSFGVCKGHENFSTESTHYVGYAGIKNPNPGPGRPEIINDVKSASTMTLCCQIINYFIMNCEIEVKYLEPKQKYRAKGDRTINETKSTVKVMACDWYTTLISTIPHMVSAHLRWQACGPGYSKRKLIMVTSHMRHGFTKEAKKLKE